MLKHASVLYQMLPSDGGGIYSLERTPWTREGPVLGGGIAQGSGEVQATEGRPDRGEHRAAGAWTRGPRSVWKAGAKDFW